MKRLTIDELDKELKQGKLRNIYLLYGEEMFLLESVLKKIKKQFGDLIYGINYVNIGEENINSILSEIETPAFGYEKKLIIVRDSGLLKKEGKRKNVKFAEMKEKLVDYIQGLSDSIVLVFIEENIEKDNLYKIIEKQGAVCNFEKQKPIQIIKRLKAICIAYKVDISEDTLKYLLECSGTSLQNLVNEIRKLIEYVRTKWKDYKKRSGNDFY